MPTLNDLKIKIFADGADLESIKILYDQSNIKGFTTNPTLMRRAGIQDYKGFALDVLNIVNDRPVSFEVFADDIPGMEAQALEIASWGKNVNIKIPITNTKGETTNDLIGKLSSQGIICNVTAIFTLEQLKETVGVLDVNTPAILSIFAGRIADTGVDPVPLMQEAVEIARIKPKSEILWASPRELLNIFQADVIGCHIITVTHDVLKKLTVVGKDLTVFSLETVSMFHRDALAAGYSIHAN
ncbi:transaldolase [Daejeonella sp.]|uniref:transaldolase n=1 Tax=Daejeonella sp. TaxID=2805397 RepID=UPI0030BCCCF1